MAKRGISAQKSHNRFELVLSIHAGAVRRTLGTRPKEETVQYMLLIYGDQSQRGSMSEEEMGQIMQAYGTFTQELQDSGAMVGGDALEPIETATTVRVRNDETLTTDGPFAETKEQLGGYYLVDAGSLDDAIEWAAKIPGAKHGSVEVRPLMVFEEEGA